MNMNEPSSDIHDLLIKNEFRKIEKVIVKWLVAKNHFDELKILFDANANVIDTGDVWICAIAARHGHLEMLKWLHDTIKYKWDEKTLIEAIKSYDNNDMIKFIIENTSCIRNKHKLYRAISQENKKYIVPFLKNYDITAPYKVAYQQRAKVYDFRKSKNSDNMEEGDIIIVSNDEREDYDEEDNDTPDEDYDVLCVKKYNNELVFDNHIIFSSHSIKSYIRALEDSFPHVNYKRARTILSKKCKNHTGYDSEEEHVDY